jgi:hypothetical protein
MLNKFNQNYLSMKCKLEVVNNGGADRVYKEDEERACANIVCHVLHTETKFPYASVAELLEG